MRFQIAKNSIKVLYISMDGQNIYKLKGSLRHAISTFCCMLFQFWVEKFLIKMQCNALRCVFTLIIEINLGLAQLALKTHAFSACVNCMSQLSFNVSFVSGFQIVILLLGLTSRANPLFFDELFVFMSNKSCSNPKLYIQSRF